MFTLFFFSSPICFPMYSYSTFFFFPKIIRSFVPVLAWCNIFINEGDAWLYFFFFCPHSSDWKATYILLVSFRWEERAKRAVKPRNHGRNCLYNVHNFGKVIIKATQLLIKFLEKWKLRGLIHIWPDQLKKAKQYRFSFTPQLIGIELYYVLFSQE